MKIKELFSGKISGSKISAMSINADHIAINNELGKFEIGDKIGKTAKIDTGKQILIFCGGILVDVIEKGV